MKIQFRILLFAFLAMSAMSFKTQDIIPAKAPWELLGVRKVNYRLDRDEIFVTAKDGVFTAIKLKIKRSPINMHKLAVHYGNGDVQEFELRNNFAAGSESRLIDLAGNKRVIQKIVFWYDTKNLASRKGLIEVWGRH